MSISLSVFIHCQQSVAADKELNQIVFQHVNLELYHSYQFVNEFSDRVTWSRISMQRKEAVTPNLCTTEELMTDTQRLRHLISEKGRGLSSGSCDITERAPRMAMVTAIFGLCGREWNTRPQRPSCKRAFSFVFSSDMKLKRWKTNGPFSNRFSQPVWNIHACSRYQSVLHMNPNIFTALLIIHQ